MSAWRREALRWTIAHDREQRTAQLSLRRTDVAGTAASGRGTSLDGWGAAMLPLERMRVPRDAAGAPWESLAGRPSLGLLATRGADVSILVADTLASLGLPAQIAPA